MIEGKGVISQMKKMFAASALALLLVGASAFSMLTMSGCSCTGKKVGQTVVTAPAATVAVPGNQVYQTNDVFTLNSWVGKTASQVGMTAEYYTASGDGNVIKISGKLSDRTASGAATLAKGSDVITIVSLSLSDTTYDEAKQLLTAEYGDPIKEDAASCSFRASSNTAVLQNNDGAVQLIFR